MNNKGYTIVAKYYAQLIYELLNGADPYEAWETLEKDGWIDGNGEWIYDND